jgi:hypothetical protein
MVDSGPSIDIDEVRATAHDCLNAYWSLADFTERCREDDYDNDLASQHLFAIKRATKTFKLASLIFRPGFDLAANDSDRHSPIFDAIVLATVGEGPRPTFGFDGVCCATAHEAALELLRMGIWHIENAEHAIGLPGTHSLGKFSGDELREILTAVALESRLNTLMDVAGLKLIRSWIDREWAAVTRQRKAGVSISSEPKQSPNLSKEEIEPKDYLFGWDSILSALGRKDSTEERGRVDRLNDTHNGPIIAPRQGGKVTAERAALIQWWNSLEDRLREIQQRKLDSDATVASKFQYGRKGEVVPEISGEVKRGRAKER